MYTCLQTNSKVIIITITKTTVYTCYFFLYNTIVKNYTISSVLFKYLTDIANFKYYEIDHKLYIIRIPSYYLRLATTDYL